MTSQLPLVVSLESKQIQILELDVLNINLILFGLTSTDKKNYNLEGNSKSILKLMTVYFSLKIRNK